MKVVRCLYGNIAVLVKINNQLAINKTIDAQILAVYLVSIVHTVDITEKVHILNGLLNTANTANIILIAMEYGFSTICADSIRIMAGMNAHCFITQNICIVTIVNQSERHLLSAGDVELIGNCKRFCVVQNSRIHLPLPTIGHIPAQIIRSLHRYITIRSKSNYHFAVHKFVLAKIGIVLFTGIICAIDIAE